MNSCHEEGVRDQNRAGIEAADPARIGFTPPHLTPETSEKGHFGAIGLSHCPIAYSEVPSRLLSR
eukprot:gene26151-biopygen14435